MPRAQINIALMKTQLQRAVMPLLTSVPDPPHARVRPPPAYPVLPDPGPIEPNLSAVV